MKIPKYIQKLLLKANKITGELEEIRQQINSYDMQIDAENYFPEGNPNLGNLSEHMQCFIDYGEELPTLIYLRKDKKLISQEKKDTKAAVKKWRESYPLKTLEVKDEKTIQG